MKPFLHRRGGKPRGFTLVELMVAVAIVGLLASIALPQFQRATLRARAAERLTIMEAIGRAANDVIMQQQRVPGCAAAACTWSGGPNPPGVPGTTKRTFDWTLAGWRDLPLVVAGDSYYSYQFVAQDAAGDGKDVTLTLLSQGDLDGDGVPSTKQIIYRAVGYAFQLSSEVPARGAEDLTTF